MTDKAYLAETLKTDFPLACTLGAYTRQYLWWPPYPLLRYMAARYAAQSALPEKLTGEAGLSLAEAEEMTEDAMRHVREQFAFGAWAREYPDTAAELVDDCEAEPITVNRLGALFLKYRDRSPGMIQDDAEFLEGRDYMESVTECAENILFSVRRMRLHTEKPESDFETQKRLDRERREQERREAQRRREVNEKLASELKADDLQWIDDIEKLCFVLRESEDEKLVEAALDRVYRLRPDDDIETVRGCLPGRCAGVLLNWLCRETHETPYRYITLNHLGRLLIPALQRPGSGADAELLDALYRRKYGHYINRERGKDLDYYETLEQFNNARTPEEAFRNVDPYDYDRMYEPDDSDEFSYISTMDEKPFRIGGYGLHSWRMKCLREADLLTDED